MNNQRTILAKRAHILAAMLCLSSLTLASGSALAQPAEETNQKPVTHIEALRPFTHISSIPFNVDPATIRFEKVKATKVATQLMSTMEVSYCSALDAKTSLYCPYQQLQSYVPAYEVTYSYAASPDELGITSSTFQVYLRPEELPAALKETLANRKVKRDRAAEYFTVKISNEPIRRVFFDEAKSNFCEGNFGEGSWTHTDSKCEDKVSYKAEMMPPDSLSVQVEAISLPRVEAANRFGK